jgi:hypothetical protein
MAITMTTFVTGNSTIAMETIAIVTALWLLIDMTQSRVLEQTI